MHPLVEILGSPDQFLDDLFDQIQAVGIEVDSLYMDHICYRVESLEEYHAIKSSLLIHGNLLSDNIVAGRPISVIQLNQPYSYKEREINVIELPSPKSGSPYATGYEHVELVVEMDLLEFVKKHPSIDFDLKGMNKTINQDVRLPLNGCSVKFPGGNPIPDRSCRCCRSKKWRKRRRRGHECYR